MGPQTSEEPEITEISLKQKKLKRPKHKTVPEQSFAPPPAPLVLSPCTSCDQPRPPPASAGPRRRLDTTSQLAEGLCEPED